MQVRVTFKTLTPGDFAARHAELTVKIAGLVWVSPSRLRLLLSTIDDRALSPPPAGTPEAGSGGGVTLLIVILPRKGAKEKSAARAADDLLAISHEAWQVPRRGGTTCSAGPGYRDRAARDAVPGYDARGRVRVRYLVTTLAWPASAEKQAGPDLGSEPT